MNSPDDTACRVLAWQETMYGQRANFNNLWQAVAELVAPNNADFTVKHVEGQRRTQRIFESTATRALEHFCAAMESMLCPASTRWHRLEIDDPALANDIEVQQYLDSVTDCLFRARYAPAANFQSQMHEVFYQEGAFGVGPLLIDDVPGYGLRYRALSLCQTYGMENSAGVIDHVQREYTMSARAAIDACDRGIFDKDKLPDQIRNACEKNPLQQFTFIHAVYPNKDIVAGAKDKRGMKFSSCQVSKEFRCTLRESGYSSQPMLLARYRKSPEETYGRGPCVDVEPEIRMLQEMQKTIIRQAQRDVAPPLLLMDDGSLGAFDLRANAMNFGAMSADGKPLVMPLQTGSRFEVSQELINESRSAVQSALLTDIFAILEKEPNMTATEVLQRAQEKGQLLAPIIGRQQSELFGPMIERELDILDRAGQLPSPPDKLRRLGSISLKVVYESQIQVTQRQGEALAINQVLQQMAPLMQIDPSVAKSINMPRTFRLLAKANGAPAGMLNTDEEMQQADAQAANQQNMTNLAQIAGPASSAIKNLAQAQQAAGSAAPGNLVGAQQ